MRTLVLSILLFVPAFAQQAVTPDGSAAAGRTVTWHGPQGETSLRLIFFDANADPHFAVFPFFIRRDRHSEISSTGRLHIPEATPAFTVQGFGYGSDWELVKLERHDGRDRVRLPSRNVWGDAFFSDQAFATEDLVGLTQSSGGDAYTLQPAGALAPGGYLLCAKPGDDQGGWHRVCYDFEITGGGS